MNSVKEGMAFAPSLKYVGRLLGAGVVGSEFAASVARLLEFVEGEERKVRVT